MNILIKAYISGVLLCVISEAILTDNLKTCMNNKLKCFILTLFFNVYGIAAVFVSCLSKSLIKLNIFIQVLFIFLLVTVLEHSMYNFYLSTWKEASWVYPDKFIPLCGGKVSVVTSLYFTALMMFFLYVIHPKL